MAKKTILIFGISSFVGSNLAQQLKGKYKVVGTYDKYKVNIPDVLTFPCDVMNKNAVQSAVYTFKPEITIYAVGLSSLKQCNAYPKYADALNTGGVFNVATFTERYKSKLCYISSSYVFEGNNKLYQEDDTPMPNTMYGKTVAGTEFFIQKSCLNYLVLRACQLYGRSVNPRQYTWIEYVQHKIAHGESFVADDSIKQGFLDVNFISTVLEMCFKNDITNRLFHVSSKDIMTYYDLTKKYAEVFKENTSLLSRGTWLFEELNPERSEYQVTGKLSFHLDSSNIENSLNISVPTIEDSIKYTYSRYGGKGKGKKEKKDSGDSGITFI